MKIAVLAAAVFFAASALANDTSNTTEPVDRSGIYYCRPLATAGMAHDETTDAWNATTFKTPDDGISIKIRSLRIAGPDYSKAWVYTVSLKTPKTGDYRACMNQEFGYEIVSWAERVDCRTIPERYIFDLEYLKYEVWSEGSYMQPKDNQTFGSPYMQLGRCEKVD
ncbi:hypothetical protein [Rhizobium phaseoli]|uniref:Uncharacterized protein n=1 Tax=Rhizobium phaseoli TaxID=396 RepID=A0ABM6CFJ7_9HYPH|nr:hypothetical protein [Rhizobium phaseoli]ANL87033.1 hypothetical protein AMC81_PA00009 [Rhizobium phaseoli]ANL93542.1 hypothetical protein AMC80_PA00009 [Rhizobium phaseoli]